MRHKKHKLNDKLHSIPIINNLCKKKSLFSNSKRLYLVSYSIPLSCMVVLLLGGIIMISPDMFMAADGKSYAVSVGEEITNGGSSDDSTDDSGDDSFGGFGDIVHSISDADAGAGIMPLANVNPSLGLSVTNSDKVIETVQGGPTAYSDHVVTITGQEVSNYTLSMSTSSANLTKPSGATTGANITGVGGVKGNVMPANRWGYALTEESNTSYDGLTYNSVPTTSTQIASGNASSDNTLNVKKKLVIAAKFGEDAAPGNYRQRINLSAVANANTVTFRITYNANGGSNAPAVQSQNSTENSVNFTLASGNGMSKSGYSFVGWNTSSTATSGTAAGSNYTVYRTNPSVTLYAVWKSTGATWSNGTSAGTSTMQGITSSFCSSSIAAGSTVTLKDDRGSSPISYKIIKMGDGTCWMAENLRLVNTTINSTNSDMTSGSFTIPTSSISGFTSSDQSSPMAYYGNDATYGAYYNWYTATAGSGDSSIDGTTGKDIAPNSICPKGWKLPAYEGAGSFYNIINGNGAANTGYKSSWTSLSGKNGYYFGNSSAFWPAAGYVRSSSLYSAGSDGFYWSRRAYNSSGAYILAFYSSNVDPQNYNPRYYGFSVRCVAAP